MILGENRVDIWQYSLQDELPHGEALLSASEQERAQRFIFSHHRRRFITAHALLRLILARYLDLSPQEIEFSSGSYGKPHLPNSPLQFNLSHSQDMALLAVGKNYPVGIDLEFFSPRSYHGIGQQLFSDRENYALQQLPTLLKPLGFFNIWAQKESLIKACGRGLGYPTKTIDLPILPAGKQIIHDPLYQQTWQLIAFMPHIICCAALCCDPGIEEIRYIKLTDAKF
ncbi:4'-phosphopantetheinyl transferase superfamily protein [Legionella septentrionalis]|uniref:4'-phosphopantetheinyl transferase superfamily protein n=1 Tax=Legionella septentrionalis TaxID=2498109 RepID=A0A433JHA1_9GAMM|nr:4'-phosphopantetheinyl transferase superfamily protein [Legionella septentrionalis]RUR00344.1 4'-phosphopantetheinyl transferase superfamily protein [Legionella septentrionalis]RUR11887.1 4'-phosphopantetheinyl transferase superfamily protein [Legionella septentrionalis]RUR17600.1 4'-phosphopantetheinyl transferase superfamily protein [Legionella septentrionalis]